MATLKFKHCIMWNLKCANCLHGVIYGSDMCNDRPHTAMVSQNDFAVFSSYSGLLDPDLPPIEITWRACSTICEFIWTWVAITGTVEWDDAEHHTEPFMIQCSRESHCVFKLRVANIIQNCHFLEIFSYNVIILLLFL